MKVKLKQIIEFVSSELDIDLQKNTRERRYVEARCLYYKLAREHTKLGLSDIGRPLKKDHTTVTHALNKVWDNAVRFNEHVSDAYIKFKAKMSLIKEDQSIEEELEEAKKKLLSMSGVDNDEYIRMRKELYSVRKRNKRFNELMDQLDTDRKKEELFLRLEATVNMLKTAVFQ